MALARQSVRVDTAPLRYKTVERILSGGERDTTNNRMELMAAIAGLEAPRVPVELTTDSQYVKQARTVGAALACQRLAHGRPQAGQESGLPGTPTAAAEPHQIMWQGRVAIPAIGNELVDMIRAERAAKG